MLNTVEIATIISVNVALPLAYSLVRKKGLA